MSSTQEVGQIFGEGSGPATAMLRSPTVLIASIGLWGMNVYLFRLCGIDHVRILLLDIMKEKEASQSNSTDIEKNKERIRSSSPQISSPVLSKKVVKTIPHNDLPEIELAGMNANSIPESRMTDTELASKEGTGVGHRHHGNTTAAAHDEVKEDPPLEITSQGFIAPGNEITSGRLISLSIFLFITLHLIIYIMIDVMGGGYIGALGLFYGLFIMAVIIPLPSTRWLRTCVEVVFRRAYELVKPRCAWIKSEPPRPVPFIDVFFADGMCSLSKVFFDWGMLIHMASHYPYPVPKSAENILIPSFFAAIPYIIRCRQCLIMHTVGRLKDDPKRYQHLLNAFKYSTSILPLCLSAYQQTIGADEAKDLDLLLLILLTVNAAYSFAWDVIMDWGMMQKPTAVLEHATCAAGVPGSTGKKTSCVQAFLRRRLRFGVLPSGLILLADAILRFSWTLRFFSSFLFPSKDAFVLTTQFLEVFRRAIWNLLRVEWENIKQNPGIRTSDEEKPFIAVERRESRP